MVMPMLALLHPLSFWLIPADDQKKLKELSRSCIVAETSTAPAQRLKSRVTANQLLTAGIDNQSPFAFFTQFKPATKAARTNVWLSH